jgi:predicted NBD/HSP70 family sugar kinase
MAGIADTLRGRNRRAVVSAVQRRPGSTRADLARATGLSTSTVSTLVAELLAAHVLVEVGTASAGGRPAVSLGIDPAVGVVVGIHLGHAALRVLVTSLDGRVLAERRHVIDVDHEPGRSLDRVTSSMLELLAGLDVAVERVLGVGVAVSAPVLAGRALAAPPMLLDWGGIDIAGRLAPVTGAVPVHLGNDATLGALAEWRLGAGAGVDDLVYVMLSEGVGSGLVIGGRLHHGAHGTAGELGHLPVVADGRVCRCGARGCLETVVGQRALVTALAHSRGPYCTAGQLLDLAEEGDVGALRLLTDAGAVVGTTLAGLCAMADPALVVIGGDLTTRARSGDRLVAAAAESLARALPPVAHHVPVVRASLGARTEALGAGLLAASAADERLAALAAGR